MPARRNNGNNGDCDEQPKRAARQKRVQSNGDCDEQPKRAARQKRAQSNGDCEEEPRRAARQKRVQSNGDCDEKPKRAARQKRVQNCDEDENGEEDYKPARRRRIANGDEYENGEDDYRPVVKRRIVNGDEDEEDYKPACQRRIKDNGECGAGPKQRRIARSPPRQVRKARAPRRKEREIEDSESEDCDNPRPNVMKSVIKQGTFNLLYFTLALVDDIAVHGAFEKNTQLFVIIKDFLTALTYQMTMQKQPTFIHLLASASIFSWLTVALFEPTFNLDFEGIKNVLVQHATNVGLLYEKFVLFRMLETVSSW